MEDAGEEHFELGDAHVAEGGEGVLAVLVEKGARPRVRAGGGDDAPCIGEHVAAAAVAAPEGGEHRRGRIARRIAREGGEQRGPAAREVVAQRGFGTPVNAVAMVNYACWSHCIDLLHHLVGPAERVTAQASGMTFGKDSVPDLAASIRFVGGAAGTILGTWSMNFGFPLFELTVNYSGGRVHLRCLDGDLEVLDYSTHRHEVLSLTRNTSRWDQYRASFGRSLGAYLDSLRQGAPPPVPGSAGLEELRFEAGLRRAVRLGRAVVLSEDFPC